MCMVADDDWDFYNEFHPKARKQHTCGECSRTIEAGEHYWTQGGLNEGNFEWHKTCEHCAIASEWLEYACDGWIFGLREADLSDHVIGHERELRSAPLTRLYRWMRADWRDRAGSLRPPSDVRNVCDKAIAAYKAQYDKALARA